MSMIELIGDHPAIHRLRTDIGRAAGSTLPVVVLGETGTGKELVVQALHTASGCKGELVPVNVAALPEQLADAELFGAVRGAYTGAHTARAGLVQQAQDGTLFLDEACDLALQLQVKLLRVLESGRVRRLGATTERPVSFRLVLTVQHDPEMLVVDGRWRPDFLYRVTGVVLRVPPLRERLSDLPLLVNAFLARENFPALPAESLRELEGHDWPGNVRELLRVVQRAILFSRQGVIEPGNLLASLHSGPILSRKTEPRAEPVSLQEVERQQIERLLRETGYNVRLSAARLGISVGTLYRRIRDYDIARPGPSLAQLQTLDVES